MVCSEVHKFIMKGGCMTFLNFYLSLALGCVILLSCSKNQPEEHAPEAASAVAAVPSVPAQTSSSAAASQLSAPAELHFGMALLADHEVALALDAKAVTWGEFKSDASAPFNLNDIRGLSEEQVAAVRKMAFNHLRMRILLANAGRDGMTVNNTDQEELNDIIRQQLALQPGARTLEEYLDKFPLHSDSFLQLSRAEMYLLMKYTRAMTRDVTVSDQETNMLVAQAKQIYENVRKLNQQLKQDLEDLLKLPEINTDQGFAELARANSEGREANRGGELNVYFTLQELREANDDQEIAVAVGENTGIIETSAAYRIIRFLQEMPPEEPGKAVRYRIAQILHMKYAEEEIPGSEDLRRRMQYQKEEERIRLLTLQSMSDYHILCPLFPAWDMKKGL